MDDSEKTEVLQNIIDIDDAPTIQGEGAQRVERRFVSGDLIINRYKVLSELGQGGMGVVYKCFDETAGIEVALKALPPELSHNTIEMDDIKDNFQLVSKLIHQNIAISRVLEWDEQTGNYYLIMECAEGEDLRRWLKQKRKEGALTPEIVLPIIRQIAASLDYAHEENVIHRDIKPGNIMINSKGRIKVLDFGLAAQIHSSMSRVSMAYHGTSGTGPYMSPEQWRGWSQGASSDQYALAVMTYEMLAGHLPFENSDAAVLREAVLNDTPEHITGIPANIHAAVFKAMSKEPKDRFASCMAFVNAMEAPKQTTANVQNKILLILLAILVIVGGGIYFVNAVMKKYASAKKEVKTEQPVVKPAAPAVKPVVKPAVPAVKPVVKPAVPAAKPVVKPAVPAAKPVVKPAVPAAKPVVKPAAPAAKPVVKPSVPAAKPVVKPAVPAAKQPATPAAKQSVSSEKPAAAKDNVAMVQEVRKKAEAGDAIAQFDLGIFYYHGIGVAKDQNEAFKWVRKSAEQGFSNAQNSLGIACYQRKKYTEAVKWYQLAVKQDHFQAYSNLAACYYYGQGVKKDYKESFRLFSIAAEKGVPVAQYYVSKCYREGAGVEKNYIESARWCRKAAKQNDVHAQYDLGVYYFQGIGVHQNYIRAVKWFEKAANQGFSQAQNNLGYCYERGLGVTKNLETAIKLYKMAAAQGNELSKSHLKRLGVK